MNIVPEKPADAGGLGKTLDNPITNSLVGIPQIKSQWKVIELMSDSM